MRFYIASSLDNAEQVKALSLYLTNFGHTHTYDWTVHGAVYKESQTWDENVRAMRAVSRSEMRGVLDSDRVIVLLPGGRGTHIELGAAIGLGKRVLIVGKEEGHHCAFYQHDNVTHVDVESITHFEIMQWLAQ